MELTKKESFALQISYYLKNKDFLGGCRLSERMIKKFPKEPLSHFMAAKCHYLSGDYKKARKEGRKAFNLSHTRYDMMLSAIVTASAHFMLMEYEEGYKLLSVFDKEKNEEVKKLLLMFSIVMGDEGRAAEYYRQLDELNRAVAERLIRDMIGS